MTAFIGRREFITCSAVRPAWPLAAAAQRIARLGYLGVTSVQG